ncbi:hypothetical protein LINGRAPRIM_LOCUS3392 [Linum grandiflorum]
MSICDLATRSNQSHGEVYSDACVSALRMHCTRIPICSIKSTRLSKSGSSRLSGTRS